jgi:alanyl-tRNA synthetase/misacylated tRNA(Ala) deacylase
MMKAELLPCVDNPDLYRFEARLTVLDEEGLVRVDPCYFHPRDEFLPGDEGWIRAGDESYEVLDVRWGQGRPLLELDKNFRPVPKHVICELDRRRRHDCCRLHTALHLVAWTAMGDRKIPRAEERILPEYGIVKLKLPEWSPGTAHEIENRVNAAVESGSPVKWFWVERDGRNRIPPYLSKCFLQDDNIERIRIVAIAQFGRQICEGPHVRDIAEIGAIGFQSVRQEENGAVCFEINLTRDPKKISQET